MIAKLREDYKTKKELSCKLACKESSFFVFTSDDSRVSIEHSSIDYLLVVSYVVGATTNSNKFNLA